MMARRRRREGGAGAPRRSPGVAPAPTPAADEAARGMASPPRVGRPDLAALAAAVLGPLALYVATLPRTVVLEDDSLFLMAGVHLGVAHHPRAERHALVRGRARSGRRPGLVPDRRGRRRPDAGGDARRPRPPSGRRPHRLDHAGPPARARHQPLRGPGLRGRRHVARTAAGVKMDTTLAPTRPAAAELERPAPTARRLAEASISPNTRRAYSGALRRLDAWLDGRPLEDATLAAYLGELHDQGRAPASAATAVAARRASGPASPASRPRPGNGQPGSSPATGGRPAVEDGGKRGRSGRRTSRPSSPPATGREVAAAAASPRRSPSTAAASTP